MVSLQKFSFLGRHITIRLSLKKLFEAIIFFEALLFFVWNLIFPRDLLQRHSEAFQKNEDGMGLPWIHFNDDFDSH
jgi:hypothetical protein